MGHLDGVPAPGIQEVIQYSQQNFLSAFQNKTKTRGLLLSQDSDSTEAGLALQGGRISRCRDNDKPHVRWFLHPYRPGFPAPGFRLARPHHCRHLGNQLQAEGLAVSPCNSALQTTNLKWFLVLPIMLFS